ncbi:unnamed protein product [Kuraishia capsulata CBS 1993]|uniref:Zn(2)-C6 fungal-type domain-containing protein n=1 Tax=Kuraishia capsulata CBS 1993 TaxID=1382522 RepID=W6MN24_9ASCO|nr:uncharacterized protein KUCA_T00003989001 [Kuraishia capsulata CBS 1993]CDK28009.1 unnamed protein product [Kuraishia capsulata CBS 1993]
MSQLHRASNACDFCRSRKIKCDEKAPSCSHCEKRGYKCIYKEVLPTKLERTLTELFHKVEKLDSKIDAAISQGKRFRHNQSDVEEERTAAIIPPGKESNELGKERLENSIFKEHQILSLLEDLETHREKSDSIIGENKNGINEVENVLSPSVSESLLTDSSHESYLIPTTDFDQANVLIDNWLKAEGLSDNTDAALGSKSCCVGIFKTTPSMSEKSLELMTEDEFSLADRFDPSKLPTVMHFPKKTVDNNIQSYLDHIYPRYPALCDDFISRIHSQVTSEGLTTSFPSCIFLLILAVGSAVNPNAANERVGTLGEQKINKFHEFWYSSEYQDKQVAKIENIPPGWEYFWMVLGIREKLISVSKPSVNVVAVRLLSSIYYLKICNISNHWKELRLASDALFDVLTYYIQVEPEMLKSNNALSEALLRYFWIILHLEREIAGVFNLKISRLAELQEKVNTPKGCRQNLFRDKDSIYAFCFMSIVSLTNIRGRATAIIPSVNSSSFDEVLEQIENYSDSLQIWRCSLPLELQWNDYHPRSAIKSNSECNLELLLVRLNYHLSVISVARLLLMKIKYFHQANLCFSSLKIAGILENCMTSMSHYVNDFLQLSISDLTPLICHEAMQVLMLIEKFRYIASYREESTRNPRTELEKHRKDRFSFLNMERSTFVDCLLKIQPFTLHSPFVLREYELCKEKLLG